MEQMEPVYSPFNACNQSIEPDPEGLKRYWLRRCLTLLPTP